MDDSNFPLDAADVRTPGDFDEVAQDAVIRLGAALASSAAPGAALATRDALQGLHNYLSKVFPS